MTNERAGAIALIAGTIAMIGVMALHPEGVHAGPGAQPVLRLGLIVHGVAIAATPLLTFGFFALSRHIGFDRPLAALAFFFFAFGAIAVMLAAAMSGLVATRLIEGGANHDLLRLEWYLNQAFATIHVAMFSAAFVLYALAWPHKGALGAALQVAGFAIGLGVLAWLFSGTLTLNVHGMGAVMLAHGLWIILAAFAMLLSGTRDAQRGGI
ncbi:MAG: hypothetical protein SGI91_08345 [Alphaproteobacteria bacterium]|jgi:hypothetical protein|nr:hypothetical protein [Alphaproteobacteria bacterium]